MPLLNNILFLLRRDPYIFNLFEVLLTTLESKLRRVENMDRALERLVRRLDTVENRLAVNLNTTAQVSRPHLYQLSSLMFLIIKGVELVFSYCL